MAGEDLTVYGDGTQTRCFTDVLDVVDALMLLSAREDAMGDCFNIGATIEVPIAELARKVLEYTGSRSDIAFIPYDEVFGEGFEELGRRVPDTSAIRRLTGWEPTRTADQTVRDVIAHERARAEASEVRERTVPLGG